MAEVRTAYSYRTAGERTLEGYATLFNEEIDYAGVREVIAPGAFTRSLCTDILALLDHDTNKVLGRTRSGTLKLHEDGKGLAFSLVLPDTQAGRDVAALQARGDIGGMSFGFTVHKGGESWDGNRRTLRDVRLHEISVVTSHAAYARTVEDLTLRHAAQNGEAERRARVLKLMELSK